ncbi:MAG: energy transducer TonB [Bacteroidota bacterium]|nr:energy transducer TonB [Bacteroidota bacterium]
MKNTFTWLLAVAPLFSFTQGVKANIYDKFLKTQRVETEAVSMAGLTGNNKLSMAFSALGSTLHLTVSGAGWGASTIDSGNELKLLFSNDSVITLKSTALQGFEPGMVQNTYRHQYLIAANQLEIFMKHSLLGIRKYSFATFTDLDIPQQNVPKLKKLVDLFVEELEKANVVRFLQQINIKDIRNHIGDSVEFCSRVYKTRYFEGSAGGPTLLDVQANFSDPIVNVVILEKDRQKFNSAPEKKYLNKDVCISGVVTLRNNIPYLVVHDREQIKVTSPIDLADAELFADDSVNVKSNVFTSASLRSDTTVKEKAVAKPANEVVINTKTTPEVEEVSSQTVAEFPGGDLAFALFIKKNMDQAGKFATGEVKQVTISFAVDAEGAWSNMRLVTSAGKELDNELTRVLARMPKWKPGTRNGVPVPSQVVYPVILMNTKVVSENSSTVKVPPIIEKRGASKDTLAAVRTVSVNKEMRTSPNPKAEKKMAVGQRDVATYVNPRPVAEEKENTTIIRTDNHAAFKTTGVRYKVRGKAYFHNEPDETTRRNAFIVHWNNAVLNPSDDKNGFIYIVFTNHLGQVSKGWLSKGDLIEIR